MKILIVNSFPEYMQVAPEDIEYIESDLGGDATVVSLNDLTDEHVNAEYDAVVSFNCVNIFHPEIAKLQVNFPTLAKIVEKIPVENRAIYQRDRYFNGMGVCSNRCVLIKHYLQKQVTRQ